MQNRVIGTFTGTTGTAGSWSGKLSNFSPNSLILKITDLTGSGNALSESDLSHMNISVQFKNRLGKNAVILNNVPMDVLAKLSDFEGGFSCNSADDTGAFKIAIGKIVLTGMDEISVAISYDSSAPSFSCLVYALDEYVGKETINIYEYAVGASGMQLTFPNAIVGYMAVSSPSASVNVRTADYFDDNLITEAEIVANGAVLGQAENFDNFGPFWADKSGYSQLLGVTCGSSNERVLVREWFYDTMRIGVAQSETKSLTDYASEIRDTDPEKYKCLAYIFNLSR